MSFVTFDHVSKVFAAGHGSVTAVQDLHFTAERGERIAIVGETGCGKSTTISLLLGLSAPTTGRVLIDGMNIYEHFDHFRGRIAAVFQTDRLLPWKSAIDNVRLPLAILGRKAADLPISPEAWLDRLGLKGFHGAYPHELSGGMRQRVAIARALVMDPDFILCDEAFGHLDEVTAAHLRREFLELATTNNRTLIFITHSIEEAIVLGQRILVLRRPGQVAAEITVPPAATPDQVASLKAHILQILSGEKQGASNQAGPSPQAVHAGGDSIGD